MDALRSDTDFDDPRPDFDTPRLAPPVPVGNAVPLLFMLPLTPPNGTPADECRVMLAGSVEAWGALVTALVRAGWTMVSENGGGG